MKQATLSATKDYEKLVAFFIENDLEFSENDPVPTDLVQCWQITDSKTKDLLGALVLAKRQGEYIIDGIAVDQSCRRMKLGKTLLDKAIKETGVLGGDKIFLVARTPEFFKQYGFVTVPREAAPTFFECFTCPQYGTGCIPEVLRLDIP